MSQSNLSDLNTSRLHIFSRLGATASPANSSHGSSRLLSPLDQTDFGSRLSLNYDGDDGSNTNDTDSFISAGLPVIAFQGDSLDSLESTSSNESSSDPDLGLVLRVGSVTQRSVGGSTVHEDQSPTRRAYHTHSSLPKVTVRETQRNQTLNGAAPSAVASNVATVGYFDNEELSSEEEQPQRLNTPDAKADANRRAWPLSNFRSSVSSDLDNICDSSSSSHSYPHLLPRPLRLDTVVRRPPHTPVNSILTPDPIIGIVPSSTTVSSNTTRRESQFNKQNNYESEKLHASQSSKETDIDADKFKFEAQLNQLSSNIARVRGTLPEALSFVPAPVMFQQPAKGSLRVPNGAPPLDYGAYAEEEYPLGRGQIPTPPPRPRMPCILNIHGECTCSDGSEASLSPQLSEYSIRYEADNPPRRSQQMGKSTKPINLYDRPATKPSPKLSSKSIEGTLPPEGPITFNEHGTPVTATSFSRMINDLEDMLNQALQIANRSVMEPNLELEQADVEDRGSAQIRNAGSPLRSSYEIPTDQAVTAPESAVDPHEKHSSGQDARRLSKGRGRRTSLGLIPKPTIIGDEAERSPDPSQSFQPIGPKKSNVGKTELPSLTIDSSGRVRIPKSSLRVINVEGEQSQLKPRIARKESERNQGTYSRSALSHTPFNPKQKFGMEIGRDGEIVLVPLPPPSSVVTDTIYETPQIHQQPPHRGGWDWDLHGKRFSAGLMGVILGLIGWVTGNFHGELPAVQKHLQLTSGVASLGNVLFFLGMAASVFVFWPLPLLHGRKPYTLMSLALMIPLQLPQGLSLPPYTTSPERWNRSMTPYIVCTFVFRAISGLILGFAFVNTFNTVLDLFGADTGSCCRGGVVFDASTFAKKKEHWRLSGGGRRGNRPGMWVALYTWLFTTCAGFGYLIGKLTIETTTPAWGFWIIAMLCGAILIVAGWTPEVRPPWVRLQDQVMHTAASTARRKKATVLERGEICVALFGVSPR